MKVIFHPEFPDDQRKYQAGYADVSAGLAMRFRSSCSMVGRVSY